MQAKKNRTAPAPKRKTVAFDEARESARVVQSEARVALATREASHHLSDVWPKLSAPKRQHALRAFVRFLFLRRVGMPWRPEWARWTKRQRGPAKRGRPFNARAAIVMIVDQRDVLRWPVARYDDSAGLVPLLTATELARILALRTLEQRQPGGDLVLRRRRRGPSRFLSRAEDSWLSLLCGNWPTVRAGAGPADVLKAEAEAMSKALDRYGQRSQDDGRLPVSRGVQREKRG